MQENALILSGQQCVDLAAGISPGGFTGFSDFLAHILANEMEQFLRGVAHLTQKHLPQLERFVRDSSQCLSKFISVSDRATNLKDCYYVGMYQTFVVVAISAALYFRWAVNGISIDRARTW